MSAVASPEHVARRDVERGKQRGGSMPEIKLMVSKHSEMWALDSLSSLEICVFSTRFVQGEIMSEALIQTDPRIRLLLEPAGPQNGYVATVSRSGLDKQFFSAGRKPCGKMGIEESLPDVLLISSANLEKMIESGCSWQRGELTAEEIERQNIEYRKGLGAQ
jgi:hypothetical protein